MSYVHCRRTRDFEMMNNNINVIPFILVVNYSSVTFNNSFLSKNTTPISNAHILLDATNEFLVNVKY
jgi:hypothetical protein